MSSIEIEIAPIEEAVDALQEKVREFFLKDLEDQFYSPLVETELGKLIDDLREGLYCVIEYPYVDKVFRDSYYNYYASKHFRYQRDSIRVSLFKSEINAEEFLNPEHHDVLNEKYLGYFTIRPTINALFGRSTINPLAFERNNFKICKCKINNLVYGVKVETEGFPHSSQDGETIKCAETTIWALLEYFGNKYPEYKPTLPARIHQELERFSFQRQLPSTGLTMDQISFALKQFGFGTRVYSFDPFEEDMYSIIDSYVESGIPLILGLQSGNIGHVIIAVGKVYKKIMQWKEVKESRIKINGKETIYYETTNIPAKYVVQDDNMVPYRVISLDNPGEHYDDEDCSKYEVDSAVVPLYPKIYLEAVVAKKLMLQVITDPTVGFKFAEGFVFRYYLASSRSFKSHIGKLGEMAKVLKNNILITKMPKFIWCGEIYTQNSFNGPTKEALGLVVLDATEANQESIDTLIFAGYPDRCITMNDNNFVTLQHPLEKYRYFNNLK